MTLSQLHLRFPIAQPRLDGSNANFEFRTLYCSSSLWKLLPETVRPMKKKSNSQTRPAKIFGSTFQIARRTTSSIKWLPCFTQRLMPIEVVCRVFQRNMEIRASVSGQHSRFFEKPSQRWRQKQTIPAEFKFIQHSD